MMYCDFCDEMVLSADEKYISITLEGKNLCWLLCYDCYEKKAKHLERIIDSWLSEEAKQSSKEAKGGSDAD